MTNSKPPTTIQQAVKMAIEEISDADSCLLGQEVYGEATEHHRKAIRLLVAVL